MTKTGEMTAWGSEVRDYTPSGILILKIIRYWSEGQFKDTKNTQLEDRLNDFVIEIYREVFKQKERDIEREKERKADEERYRLEEEQREREEIEQQKIQALEREALNWQKSQTIQAYLEAARKAHIDRNGKIEPGGDFEKRLSWAQDYINKLNPLKANVQGHKQDILQPFET